VIKRHGRPVLCLAVPAFFLVTVTLRADCSSDVMMGIYNRHLFRPGQDVARNAFLIELRNTFLSGLGVNAAYCEGKAYAWELLGQVAKSVPRTGADWSRWKWREPGDPGPSLFNEVTGEYLKYAGAAASPSDFDTFELVHFNPEALKHASRQMIARNVREKANKLGWRDFQQFPSSSTEVKTIWRRIPQSGCIALGVWDGPDGVTAGEIYGDAKWRRHVLVYDSEKNGPQPSCRMAASRTRDTDPQLRAQDHFVWMRVSSTTVMSRFKAVPDGKSLTKGDLLILAGMHVSRKDIPDWSWMTTWWKGKEVNPTTQETVGRDGIFPEKSVWNHYVATYTLSFQYPCSGTGCSDDHRTFAYNPYLEAANLPNGTSSNCIACHAKARYGKAINDGGVPPMFGTDLGVFRFEGATLTDYSWTAGKN
jgi:hypothetical protein